MKLPFSIFGRVSTKTKILTRRRWVAAVERLEDRLTPAIVDLPDVISASVGPLPLVGGIRYEGGIIDGLWDNRDVDLIGFEVLEGATLRIETSRLGANPDLNTYLRLFTEWGTELTSDDDSGSAPFSLINAFPLPAGIYYVGVSGWDNDTYDPNVAGSGVASATGFYALTITDTSFGVTINGFEAEDLTGASVSSAGDVNGDGFDDIIIGAPGYDLPYGETNAGGSYVVFGNGSGFGTSLDLATLNGTLGFFVNGVNTGDNSGGSVSSAGDINGDGFGDIIIGALYASGDNKFRSGQSYVVFGKASPFDVILNPSQLNGTNGFVINGIDVGDYSGVSVSSAGDVNGDGFDDLIIGGYWADANGQSNAGESYVVFGKASGFGASFNLSSLNGTNGFVINGIDVGDYSGVSVSSAGDVNGDGFDDLIIGAYLAGPFGLTDAGESYVVFGKGSGFGASLNLSSLDGTNGFVINGIDIRDSSGRSVSSAGDVNGDGFDDLIIGGDSADVFGQVDAGESYVVFGKASGFGASLNLTTLDGVNGFVIKGTDAGDYLGVSVGSAGDVNGDGYDDLIIGADRAAPNSRTDAGQSYVVFGKAGGFEPSLNLSTLDSTSGFVINGVDAGDELGHSVRAAGDVNGDGFADLIVGAPRADANGNSNAGESYLIFGRNFTNATIKQGTLNADTLNGAAGADTIVAGQGNDTINGVGVGDVIYAGQGNDRVAIANLGFRRIDGGSGVNRLVLTGANRTLDLSSLADNVLTNFGEISISGSGDNTLIVTPRDVQNMQRLSNTLRVTADAGDIVRLIGQNWSWQNNERIFGTDYYVFSSGQATIKIPQEATLQLPVSLDGLDGERGFTINGIDAGDLSGNSVSSAGDINGDGFEDLIIGGYSADADGRDDAGESYVVFGKASGFSPSLNLSTLNGTNGFVINGIDARDLSGFSVSSAGDVNGDGFDDLIIGAPLADANGQAEAGESYVVFGKASGFSPSLNLSTLNGTNGFVINGIDANDLFGVSVGSAGDINGDGFDDMIVGAPTADPVSNAAVGESYVVFGKASGFTPSLNLSTLNGTNGFVINGIDVNDFSGISVSSAGDVNGDGFDDLIIGAKYGDPNGVNNAGESYVVFGKGSGFEASLNLSSLGANTGFVINGVDPNDQSGTSVSSAGDVNGDGFDDLIIGAKYGDPNGVNNAGESYVVFGKASGFSPSLNLSTLNGTNGFVINGIGTNVYSGGSVSSAGDVNGDGFDDLIIGASYADPNGVNNAGESYVVFGKASGFEASLNLSSLNATSGFVINGIDVSNYSGGSVSSAGDVNGDGFDDLIIGARVADPDGRANAGASYVIFGRDFSIGAIPVVSSAGESLVGTLGINTIVAGQGSDTIIGNGGADVLYGGQGNDRFEVSDLNFRRIDGGTGADKLLLNASNATFNLRTFANNRLTSIEAIDFVGSKNTLILSNLEVANLTNNLTVSGPAGGLNKVELKGGWSVSGQFSVNGRHYRTFTYGGCSVFIENTVQVSGPKVELTGGTPVVGDWNADGKTDLGYFKDGMWYLDFDGSRQFEVNEFNPSDNDLVIQFGQVGDRPAVGNWDGIPGDDVGVYRGVGDWILDSNGSRTIDPSDQRFNFGVLADQPVVGDWNGDGRDEVGSFRGPDWYLEVNGIPGWQGNDYTLVNFGTPTDTPVVAAWGKRDVVVAIPNFVGTHPVSRAGVQRGKNWYLDTDRGLGHGGTDTTIFNFGEGFPADRSLGGDWDGNGVDETGVYRFSNAAWYLDTDGLPNHGGNDTSLLDLVFVNPVAPLSAGLMRAPLLRTSSPTPDLLSNTKESGTAEFAMSDSIIPNTRARTNGGLQPEPLPDEASGWTRIVDEAIEIEVAIDSLLW
jgi:hypothetical protein